MNEPGASRPEAIDEELSGEAKWRSVIILFVSQVLAMSLWFVSAAVLVDLTREIDLAPWRQAALSSAVQAGFVAGALAFAVFGWSDRYDPRRVFAIAAVDGRFRQRAPAGGIPADSNAAIAVRFATGALLAGIYPVAMKMVVGWGLRDRGFLVGTLVGALTLGSASSHLFAWFGGSDWRATVVVASAGLRPQPASCVIASKLGPYHGTASRFDPGAIMARLDQPPGASRLRRLPRPHVGTLCDVVVGRRRRRGFLPREPARRGRRGLRQADGVRRDRGRWAREHRRRIRRRPGRQGQRCAMGGGDQRHGGGRDGR